MLKLDTAERRRRIGTRHHLATGSRATSVVEAARGMVALHATDPASVYLEALARVPRLDVATMEEALYDERSLVRILGMRRTMFVVPPDFAPVIQAACTDAIAVTERKRTTSLLAGAGIGGSNPGRWLRDVEAKTMAALEARGEAVATELTKDVPELATQIPFGAGKTWQGTLGVSTRVLFLLSMEGRILRARPRGSWISSQYRWTPADRWLPGGIAPLAVDEARVELVRSWLATFGPGTVADLRWWTGWTLGEVRKALARLATTEVDLDGVAGLVLEGDEARTPTVAPWVGLLPPLDATIMGWTGREWYLGAHRSALFDRSGNAGPTVWADGRVAGGWGQGPGGKVVWRLLEDVGSEARSAIEREAARVEAFVGPVRVIPRFRTPLEQELARGT
ncbi:MAG TPA: winged helix DNA-binding domain-containing protein [Candidatus Limnocylindrales bacterium]